MPHTGTPKTLDVCPEALDLCFSRGDTVPYTLTITSDGTTAINITGYTFALTVDPSPAPADALNNLFALVGSVTDGPNGIVEFELSAVQSDQSPGVYFYDVQMTDGAGKIRTVASGQYEFLQDVTK
jgi:hypothetical protein